MIGALDPHCIPRAYIRSASEPCTGMFSVPLCGECGTAAGSERARRCGEAVCGLLDRQHHDRCNAA